MARLPEKSVGACVTSPPYNLGIKYRKYDDSQKRELYLEWTRLWIKGVDRLLSGDGSFFLNVGAAPSNPLLPHQLVFIASDYFKLQNTFHWIKSVTVTQHGEEVTVGHFKPINSARYVNDCHEYIFHFTRSGNVPINRKAVGVAYADKSNLKRWSHTEGCDVRCRGNTWFIPYKTIQNRSKQRPHPATFPVRLVQMCLCLHGGDRSNLTVLDPFVGIGNSAIAAKALEVKKFIGFDIDEDYIKITKQLL